MAPVEVDRDGHAGPADGQQAQPRRPAAGLVAPALVVVGGRHGGLLVAGALVDGVVALHRRLLEDHHVEHSLKDLIVWREEEALATQMV